MRARSSASANSFGPFAVELALQRLGEGRNPDRAARLLGPQRRRREIGERLADPGAGLGEQQVGRVLARASARRPGHRLGHRPLALARLGAAGQPVEPCARIGRDRRNTVRGGGRSAASSHCFRREKSIRSPRSGRSSRAPINGAQPQPSRCKRRVRRPRAFALAPVGIVEAPTAADRRSRCKRVAASASLAGGSSPSARLSPPRSAPRTAPDG